MSNKDRFSYVPEEDLKTAQKTLDSLCKKHDLEPWDITEHSRLWKELTLRMIGVPIRKAKAARRPKRNDELIQSVGRYIETHKWFDDLIHGTLQCSTRP